MKLFSVLVTNSSVEKQLDTISVHGWIKWAERLRMLQNEEVHRTLKFICCVRYKSGRVVKYFHVKREHWIHHERVEEAAWQLQCDISDRSPADLPEAATIRATTTNRRLMCPIERGAYVTTEFGYLRGGLAIYLKVSQSVSIDLWFNHSNESMLTVNSKRSSLIGRDDTAAVA